jgi:hypothetical protein
VRSLRHVLCLDAQLVAGPATNRTRFPSGCPSGTDGAGVSQKSRGQRDHCTFSCTWMCQCWPGVQAAPGARRTALPARMGRTSQRNRTISATNVNVRLPAARVVAGRASRTPCPPGPSGTDRADVSQKSRGQRDHCSISCAWMCNRRPGMSVAPCDHRAALSTRMGRACPRNRAVSAIVATILVPGCALGGRARNRSRRVPTGPPCRHGRVEASHGNRAVSATITTFRAPGCVHLDVPFLAGRASRTGCPPGRPPGVEGAGVSRKSHGQHDRCTMSCAWMCHRWPGVQVAPGAHRAALPVRMGRTSHRNRPVSATIANARLPAHAPGGRACKSHPVPTGLPFRHGWGGRLADSSRSARSLHNVVRLDVHWVAGRAKPHPVHTGLPFRHGRGGLVTEIALSARSLQYFLCLDAHSAVGSATNRTRCPPGCPSCTDGADVLQKSRGQRDHCTFSCTWACQCWPGVQVAPGAPRAALPVRMGRTSHRDRAVSATIAHYRLPACARGGRACHKSRPAPIGPLFRHGWGGSVTEIAWSARDHCKFSSAWVCNWWPGMQQVAPVAHRAALPAGMGRASRRNRAPPMHTFLLRSPPGEKRFNTGPDLNTQRRIVPKTNRGFAKVYDFVLETLQRHATHVTQTCSPCPLQNVLPRNHMNPMLRRLTTALARRRPYSGNILEVEEFWRQLWAHAKSSPEQPNP